MGLYNEGFRDEFEVNVKHALQQMETMLTPCITQGTIDGEYLYTDFLDTFTAAEITGRNADTSVTEPTYTRRRVAFKRYAVAPIIDRATSIKMSNSNDMEVVRDGAIAAIKRSMDTLVYTAFDSDVETGRVGGSTETFDATNTVSGTSGLTSSVLISASTLLDNNAEGYMMDDERYIVCTPNQIGDLLGDTNVTSADYNVVRALVAGDVDSFMGFKFVKLPTKQITVASDIRKCFAFTKQSMFWGVGDDLKVRITERDDKNFSTQIFVEYMANAVRHYNDLVVKLQCTES